MSTKAGNWISPAELLRGINLEMRTRLLLAAEMGEPALLVRDSAARRRKLIAGRHALLVRE